MADIDIKVIESKHDEDCGCLEEEVEIEGACCWTHLQPCGVADVHLDFGNFEVPNLKFNFTSRAHLYEQVRDKIKSLPYET